MAADLISLEDAKAQLQITTTDDDAIIQAKSDEATEIILDYIGRRGDLGSTVEWTALTAPRPVIAAIKIMLTHLYEHRGDDMTLDDKQWEAVARLLARIRDSAFA
jgi:hypothetical protein